MALVAGIDGCPGGWLCLTKNLSTSHTHAQILPDINALLAFSPRPDIVAIDIPIGLPDVGPRECDQQARALLKFPRSCRVFPAPIRPILAATSYPDACRIRQRAEKKKMSRQAFGIVNKILEVDTFLRADHNRQQWIREVHPELSFWKWNDERAMVHRKKSCAGRTERETLVNSVYADAYARAQSTLPPSKYANDDLVDAFAALWTAHRMLWRTAITLPTNPPLDSAGLRMEILA